jgi:hypothetical protein
MDEKGGNKTKGYHKARAYLRYQDVDGKIHQNGS